MDNCAMNKRLKDPQTVEGTNGEKVKITWMPNNRVRLTFVDCGKVSITKVFAAKITNIEVSYRG